MHLKPQVENRALEHIIIKFIKKSTLKISLKKPINMV